MLNITRKNIIYTEEPIGKILKHFSLPSFQRNKDEAHVEQLYQKLLLYYDNHNDIVLTGSISIGKKENEWIVFDGQHRLHALSKLLIDRPSIADITIRVDMYLVETEEQIHNLYQIINTSEKVTIYRNIIESKTAPAFETWFHTRYEKYCKTTTLPKGINVNLKEITKRMNAVGLLKMSAQDLLKRLEELIIFYGTISREKWLDWGIDSKRYDLLSNDAYPFYLGLYRHYEWIPRLLISPHSIEHYTQSHLPRITIPKKIRQAVWNKSFEGLLNGHCLSCKEPLSFSTYQVGHNIPLSRGGSNHITNLEVICATCNNDMGTMSITEYSSLFEK